MCGPVLLDQAGSQRRTLLLALCYGVAAMHTPFVYIQELRGASEGG